MGTLSEREIFENRASSLLYHFRRLSSEMYIVCLARSIWTPQIFIMDWRVWDFVGLRVTLSLDSCFSRRECVILPSVREVAAWTISSIKISMQWIGLSYRRRR